MSRVKREGWEDPDLLIQDATEAANRLHDAIEEGAGTVKKDDITTVISAIYHMTDEGWLAVVFGQRGGRRGGLARAKALSPERRKEIARTAALARWSKEKGESGGMADAPMKVGIIQTDGTVPESPSGSPTRAVSSVEARTTGAPEQRASNPQVAGSSPARPMPHNAPTLARAEALDRMSGRER